MLLLLYEEDVLLILHRGKTYGKLSSLDAIINAAGTDEENNVWQKS